MSRRTRRPSAQRGRPSATATPGTRTTSEAPRHRAEPPEGTWLAGDTLLARQVGRPLAGFVRVEAAGAALLAAAVVAALLWANTPWRGAYDALWSTRILVEIGPVRFDEGLQATLNDAAMVLFFFAIGLEVKQELVVGSLRQPKAVALPIAAALGGMVVPAALYAMVTVGAPAARGWAVPMPTDVALALGVVLLAGRRVARPLVVFLLTLAVVDDIGVIVVIAVFYSAHLHPAWLAAAAALFGVVIVMKRLRIWHVPVYVAVGTAVWYATWRSGIHPTVAGVALGLLAPARPLHRPGAHRTVDLRAPDPDRVRRAGFLLRESLSVAERLQHVVQPWVAFVVLPLFALANAGIRVDVTALSSAFTSRAGVAVLAARLAGKPLGIVGGAWLATRVVAARLPVGVRWPQIAWVGLLGGVGFTVSVYVAGLAFGGTGLDTTVKLTVVVATVVAALSGLGLRASSSPSSEPPTASGSGRGGARAPAVPSPGPPAR